MKLPKIEKLPSGNWHIQVQVEGERYSITNKDKLVVKQQAKELLASVNLSKKTPYTVAEAMDKYIALKERRLSPATILGYKKCRKKYLQSLMNKKLFLITDDDIQDAIDEDEELGYSPKTIRNGYGLLTATLKRYRSSYAPHVDLPEKDHTEIVIPTEREFRRIWEKISATEDELPILLAGWMGLRMSEIAGLKYQDLDGDHLHVQRARVQGPDGLVIKGTKTYSGDRRIKVPKYVLSLIQSKYQSAASEYIIEVHRGTINKHFNAICHELGLRQYRIHDLRHFAASEALMLNIPNKYQMKRMGHKTDHMLRTVYQHTIRDKEDYFADILDAHMLELQTPVQT